MQLSTQQKTALNKLKKSKRLYLAWDVGSGKSFFCAYAILHLHSKHAHIVCPKSVIYTFMEEFKKIGMSEDIFALDSKKNRDLFYAGKVKNRIILMSYDAFRNDRYNFSLIQKPEILIFDEAHGLKNPKSTQGKKARTVVKSGIEYVVLCSGTPVGNSMLDLWNQIFILDNGARLGDNYYKFLNTFFYDKNSHRSGSQGHYPKWVLRPGKEEEIMSIVSDLVSISDASSKVKLPNLTSYRIMFNLTKEQKAVYDSIRKEGAAYLKNSKGIPIHLQLEHTLTIHMKLRQVCSGFVYGDSGLVGRVKTYKDAALIKIVKELNVAHTPTKILVWTVFKDTYSRIAEVLESMGIESVPLIGGLTTKKFNQNCEAFKYNSNIKAAILHPKSGGAGLNLQEARASIWYSEDFSFIDAEQAKGRNYRRGSLDLHSSIIRYSLVTKSTVEELIGHSLVSKRALAESFRDQLLET